MWNVFADCSQGHLMYVLIINLGWTLLSRLERVP